MRADRGFLFGCLFLLCGSVLTLVFARVSELLPGVVPCPLCLLQRWPWRLALVLAILGLLLSGTLRRFMFVLGLLSVSFGAGIAVLHVGVERKWWPSPIPTCSVQNLTGMSVDDLLANLPRTPGRPCDEPTYLFETIPFTMAELNLVWSVILCIFLLFFIIRGRMTR